MRVMPTFLAAGLAIASVLGSRAALARADGGTACYHLVYGDEINVVFGEDPRLDTRKLAIRPDGRISLPLVGEVDVAGLTVSDLADRLDKAYATFVVHPHVVVNVASFHPEEITVLGMVSKPGMYVIEHPIAPLEAVALAGGFDRDRADRHDVVIRDPDGSIRHVDLQPTAAAATGDPSMLSDGDILEVGAVWGPDWGRILPEAAYGVTILTGILWFFTR